MGTTNFNSLAPAGYQAISATSSTAVACTVPTPTAPGTVANSALFVCETNAARWRDDGTDPTAAVGTPLAAGQALDYDGRLSAIRFISQAGTTTVHANYYRNA